MAEALGVTASILQLADVTIRTSLSLYSFFTALQSAQHDFQQFLIVIRNVHDALQMLRLAVGDHPLNAMQQDAMRLHLERIQEELSSINKTVDGKDPAKLSTRVKWVLKSAGTDRALQRLETDKTSLLLLIQALNLERSGRILRSQTATEASTSALQSSIEEHHIHRTAMHSQLGKRMDELSSEIELGQALYRSSLQDGFSSLSREIQVSEEHVDNTFRFALEQHFRPMLEEALTSSEMRNEARIQEFRTVMDSATAQIMERINRNERHTNPRWDEDESRESKPSTRIRPNDRSPGRYVDVQFSSRENVENENQDIGLPSPHAPSSRRPTALTECSSWACIPWIGTFRIEFRTHTEPSRLFYTFKIDFWPSSKVLRANSISLKYSSRPDRQGYVAMSPSLAFHPIIPDDDPIWELIYREDLSALTTRFHERRNGPFDQNDIGHSLLSVAAGFGKFKVVNFLVGQGADPTHTTCCGHNALHQLFKWAINEAFINRVGACTCCIEMNFPAFFTTSRSLICLGCDLEDCRFSIYDVITHPRFCNAFLNQGYSYEKEEDDSSLDGEIEDAESTFGRGSDSSQPNCYIEEGEAVERGRDSSFDHNPTEVLTPEEVRYLRNIQLLAEFLKPQGLDIIQPHSPEDLHDGFLQSPRMNLRILLACGLDSNFENPLVDHMKPVLFIALSVLNTRNDALTMDNIVLLIAGGADIYHVEWAVENWAARVEDGLMTPTAYAKAAGILPQWLKAVTKAGYDPEEVLLEDIRKRREFRLLHGVQSSSVEIGEASGGPGTQEVRRRTAGRAEMDNME